MRHLILAAAGAAALLPAAAHAQLSAADQAMAEGQRRLQLLEQTQRVDQVQRQVEDLDYRVRTAETVRSLEDQRAQVRANIPPVQPLGFYSNSRPVTQAELKAAEARREASIAASEARLKALGDQQKSKGKKNK